MTLEHADRSAPRLRRRSRVPVVPLAVAAVVLLRLPLLARPATSDETGPRC